MPGSVEDRIGRLQRQGNFNHLSVYLLRDQRWEATLRDCSSGKTLDFVADDPVAAMMGVMKLARKPQKQPSKSRKERAEDLI